ncbi:MAG: thioredoxin-dependent thiol peroxidase [Bacteroidales bacterium]|nr:thioredoxin-dependent thiol peroxidase [Bacteroidales bacterium]
MNVGDQAPDFKAVDQDGNPLGLADYKGCKLILFFYPKASTPGCTAESCNLRDNYEMLLEKGFKIIGVSADTAQRQKNFQIKNNFQYPLIPDTEKEIIQAYGVWGLKKFMGKEYDGIHRLTFIIDEKGIIEKIITKVKTKDHAAQILSEL